MTRFRQGAGVVVASDTKATVEAFDGALLNGHRLCISVMEAAQGAGIPVGDTQKLYASLSSGIAAVIEGRAHMVSAVRRMTAIKDSSNIRVENYGCPDGFTARVTDPICRVSTDQEA